MQNKTSIKQLILEEFFKDIEYRIKIKKQKLLDTFNQRRNNFCSNCHETSRVFYCFYSSKITYFGTKTIK